MTLATALTQHVTPPLIKVFKGNKKLDMGIIVGTEVAASTVLK